MSGRFRIGVKPGYGPAIKAMRDAADDPWTTPNDEWDKFIINSEVQEIAYGHTGVSHTFVPADYAWPNSTTPDTHYWPDAESWVWRSDSQYYSNNGRAYLNLYVNVNNIPGVKLNSFHFVVRDASDWRWLWIRKRYNYNSGDTYDITKRYYPHAAFSQTPAITWHSTTDSWTGGIGFLWPAGRLGSNNIETSGPNSLAYYRDRTFKFAYYNLDLPMDASPYPAVTGVPVTGQKVLRLGPGVFKMAKPGFDYRTATDEQLLFSDTKSPLKIVRTGVFTIAPSSVEQIDLGANYDPVVFVDYQCNVTGEDVYLPPMRGNELAAMDVSHRIVGSNLEFRNDSGLNLTIRYFVMAQDNLEPSVGTKKVFELKEDGFVIRRQNTDGTRFADVILDTSMPIMPIIAQGWIPVGSMVASDSAFLGQLMTTVSFDSKGTKPYILARLCRRHKTNTNLHIFQDFVGKRPQQFFLDLSDSSFTARVSDSQVRFYCSTGSRIEDAWDAGGFPPIPTASLSNYETVGIRYYVFAIPSSL